MWPTRRKSRTADLIAVLDEAVPYTVAKWPDFWPGTATSGLVDVISEFLDAMEPLLRKKFFELRRAPEDLFLIVVVKAIERSGTHTREQVEEALGITLPD